MQSRMSKNLQKMFMNDVFFAIITLFPIVAAIPFAICKFMYLPGDNAATIMRITVSLCMVVLYRSYMKHSKNVMKGMMGAILMATISINVVLLVNYPSNMAKLLPSLLFAVALFVMHFVINGDRHSRPVLISINRFIAIIYAHFIVVIGIWMLKDCVNAFDVISEILMCIAQVCIPLGIICIEARLDGFRQKREAAGWTEESGYPEGYVR